MTQLELDRHVSCATGESLREIRRRGFSEAAPLDVNYDPEAQQARPSIIDWDDLDASRTVIFPTPRRQRRRLATA